MESPNPSYWCGTGKHQNLLTRLLASNLIPQNGPSEHQHGELLKSAIKVYNDVHDHGGWNLDDLHPHIEDLRDVLPLLQGVSERDLTALVDNLGNHSFRLSSLLNHGYGNVDDISIDPADLESLMDAVVLYVASMEVREDSDRRYVVRFLAEYEVEVTVKAGHKLSDVLDCIDPPKTDSTPTTGNIFKLTKLEKCGRDSTSQT